jgi:D-amino-acid dehydrogenase
MSTRPDVSITDYDRKIVYARIGEQLRVAAMVDIVGFDPAVDPKRLALIKRQARHLSRCRRLRRGCGMGGHAPGHPHRRTAAGRHGVSQSVAQPRPRRARFHPGLRQRAVAQQLIGQQRTSIDLHGLNPRAA